MRRQVLIAVGAAAAALFVTPAAMAGTGHGTEIQDHQGLTENLGPGLKIERSGSVAYVSGGVGDDQQNAIARVSKNFNLKLTMATSDGKYIGGGNVRIQDEKGTTVLDARSKGPMFLAKLPAGKYKVHVDAEGRSYSRDVTVQDRGQQQVTMTWPSSGDEPVRAGDAPLKDIDELNDDTNDMLEPGLQNAPR